jgi:hypothetical protein
MSAFTPTFSRLEPGDRPDNLSSAVMNSLSRPIYGRVAWNPVKMLVLGGLTFGLAPLLAWPGALARFITAEQLQFWHLLEWMHIRTGDAEAPRLRDRVQKHGGPSPMLWVFPVICVIFAANLVTHLNGGRFNWDSLVHTAYVFPPRWIDFHFYQTYFRFQHPWQEFFRQWNLCLSVGFFLHWLNVRAHMRRVNELLSGINVILAKQQLPPLPSYGVGIGFRPNWMIAGLIGLMFGAVWAIPAAFAGAIHQRYVRRTSTRIRAELALRVSTALSRQRPAMNVPMPQGFRVVCRNELCGQTIPPGGAFCPRCGTSVPRWAIG